MTRSEFIEKIRSDVSEDYSISLALKPKRIDTIINNTLRHFWQHYEPATQTEYIILDVKMFQTESFKNTRRIKLPKCVRAVYECKETNGGLFINNINPDYRKTGNFWGTAVMGNSDNMVYAVTAQFYYDFTRKFVLRDIGFDYNDLSNDLLIQGRDPNIDVILVARINLDEEDVFNSDLFYRYVRAEAKKSLGTIGSIFDFKLIGETTLNISQIKDDGKEELAECKEEIKRNNSGGDFFIIGDQFIY
jgi:hypothetical protein